MPTRSQGRHRHDLLDRGLNSARSTGATLEGESDFDTPCVIVVAAIGQHQSLHREQPLSLIDTGEIPRPDEPSSDQILPLTRLIERPADQAFASPHFLRLLRKGIGSCCFLDGRRERSEAWSEQTRDGGGSA